MRESRCSMREEMQKRMEKEGQHYQRRGSLFRSDVQGVKFFKCKEGPNLLDILSYDSGKFDPIESDSLAYVLRVFIHRGVSQDGGDIICIEQTFKDQRRRDELFGKGSFCPVCKEHRNRVSKGATKEETDGLRYSAWPRTIYNVYDRRDPGAGVQIWETSAWLLQQYLDVISKKSILPGESQTIENYIAYMDIEDGRSISFERQGMDEKTKFIGVKFEERRSAITDEIANSAKSLDELILWPSVASAYEAFWGIPMDGASAESLPGQMLRQAKYDKDQQEKVPESKEKEEKDVPEEVTMTAEEREEAELQAKLDALKKKKLTAVTGKREEGRTAAKKETKEVESGKCPSGHVFGQDIDEKPECEKCSLWKECAKESDRLERAAR